MFLSKTSRLLALLAEFVEYCSCHIIFQIPVPQNDDMKKKWEEALGFTIKKSYHICATHFED
ncbi:hypothetical protein QTP88_012677 [Uroleucon formosanum]